MTRQHALIVDDEKNIRLTLSETIGPLGFVADTAVNGEEALDKIAAREYQVVLLDLNMPGIGGMEVLRRLRSTRPGLPVIIITAHGTVDSAVEAMKLGRSIFCRNRSRPMRSARWSRRHWAARSGRGMHLMTTTPLFDEAGRRCSRKISTWRRTT